MSRRYFIQDALGSRHLAEQDLPLSIGGQNHRGVVLPGAADTQLSAWLAQSEGHAYIQAAEARVDAETEAYDIYLNDEIIVDSAWLKSGDIILIGTNLISWTVQGDKVLIDVLQQPGKRALQPPLQPPPTDQMPVSDTMPVPSNVPAVTGHSRRWRYAFFTLASLLLLAAGFMLLATPVVINIQPAAQKMSMQGFPPAINLWGSRLALPGRYIIEANKPGYMPLREAVDIQRDGTTILNYRLNELPGLLKISTSPESKQQLLIDDEPVSPNDKGWIKLSRGDHQLRIETLRYLPHEQSIDVKGYGEQQQLDISLSPAWAQVSIDSEPPGAMISIDGKEQGSTPKQTEILQGDHTLELLLEAHKPFKTTFSIKAGLETRLGPFSLEVEDGTLLVSSQAQGASIMLDGVFKGTTPLELDVTANMAHTLQLSKAGYLTSEQTISLAPLETRELSIALKPRYGTVYLTIEPADAKIQVDGRPQTVKSGRLRLSAHSHTLTVSKPGYQSHQTTFTPREGVGQNLRIKLVKVGEPGTASQTKVEPATINTPAGQLLKLIKPGAELSMGASRREAGRRANESRRRVQFKRSFYFGSKEVSNAEFRKFKPSHTSGQLDGTSLNGEQQPVVNISWDDATRYCNWLSKQQGLPEAYLENNGQMQAIFPPTTGYRLPTEAEWAWVARQQGHATIQRYPWSGGYPPRTVSGNYADARIADTLADVVPDYDDGYRGTAVIGSFAAYPEDFYDLGGNVSEWMHDYYALYPGEAETRVIDPSGPATGEHHVVRGASWRHGNMTELRLSYRDYSNKPRYDLGFRIARYAE